ncbi:MAG: phosphodiester glycosidase family protein [Armatimonadota bacterium]
MVRIVFAVAFLIATQAAACAGNIAHNTMLVRGARVEVVTVNLRAPDVRISAMVAKKGPGDNESFASMLKRTNPRAAVTGTFFCTKSLLPVGDIVIEGNRVYAGGVGTGICITRDNKVDFVPIKKGQETGWADYDLVVCSGPMLVRGGKVSLSPKSEGFSDPSLFGGKLRAALGVTKNDKLLLVTVETPVGLWELARIMVQLGATEAVNLDGGTSSALYYNGSVLTRPGRKLTNLIVAYEDLTTYYARRQELAPTIGPIMSRVPAADVTGELSFIDSIPAFRFSSRDQYFISAR